MYPDRARDREERQWRMRGQRPKGANKGMRGVYYYHRYYYQLPMLLLLVLLVLVHYCYYYYCYCYYCY